MKALVFAEQFYYPEGWGGAQLPRDVTMHLARSGFAVEVVCGSDQYAPMEGNGVEDPRSAGVVIRRTPRFLGGEIHRKKLLKQLLFYASCLPLLFLRRRPDLYLTQTNPPLLVPAMALASLVHRRPFVIIAQDLYPEVLFAHGMARPDGFAGKVLTRLFRWAYGRATRVIALGDVMARRLVEKGVRPERISIISNWATGMEGADRSPQNPLRGAWSLAGQFVILYSGNLGIAHDVETPIEALRILLQRSRNVRLVFVGKGSRLAEARRRAEEAEVLHAVQFHDFVPAEQLAQSLGVADVALVTLREGFEGLVVPSKLLGYMARAIPTIYVGPESDVGQVLSESRGGVCLRNGDAEGMARAIEALLEQPDNLRAMGSAAQEYYDARLTRTQGLSRYTGVVESVLASSGD